MLCKKRLLLFKPELSEHAEGDKKRINAVYKKLYRFDMRFQVLYFPALFSNF